MTNRRVCLCVCRATVLPSPARPRYVTWPALPAPCLSVPLLSSHSNGTSFHVPSISTETIVYDHHRHDSMWTGMSAHCPLQTRTESVWNGRMNKRMNERANECTNEWLVGERAGWRARYTCACALAAGLVEEETDKPGHAPDLPMPHESEGQLYCGTD